MKTKILTAVMFIGFSYFVNAQTTSGIASETIHPAVVENHSESNVIKPTTSNFTEQEGEMLQLAAKESIINSENANKKELKTWHYIVGGVFLAAIIVFRIVAPDGISSR